tara:strand:+ start:2277 stop:2930 length:654 start_codon:yes stop_codon:yes gene_type:complete
LSNKKIRNINDLKFHYNNLFSRYKNSYLTAQQSSRKTQEIRMNYLIYDINLKNKHRILDFGCGTAHFYEYLKKKKKFVFYTGVDIADKIIRFNKKKYLNNKKVKFLNLDILKSKAKIESFDYIFISGTFNNKIDNNWLWMRKCLSFLFKRTKKALIFNNLSKYVDYYDSELFYIEPEKVFKFCKKNLSQYVKLKNDYQIKKKVIPFEFTTYVFKKKC